MVFARRAKRLSSFTLVFCLVAGVLLFSPTLVLSQTASTDKPIELRLSTFFPVSHCTNQYMIYPLSQELEKATNGKVKITIFPGGTLGKAADHYDMAVRRIADITQGIQGFTAGRFPLTSVGELPFLFPVGMSAQKVNRAMWDLYESIPELQAEYKDVKVLAFYFNEPGNIYTRSKLVKSLDDFKGQKIRSPMPTAAEMLKALGAAPVTMPTGDLYVSLERGSVDGTLFNTANMNDWKLWEVVKYYTNASFYNLAWFLVMNRDTWNSLPPDIQKKVNDTFNLHAGVVVGEGFDKDYVKNIEIAKQKGIEIFTPAADELEKWKQVTLPVHESWVATMESKGLPGKKVLEEAKKLIKKYQ
jgi:TRAP-type transport system periplasmic protein